MIGKKKHHIILTSIFAGSLLFSCKEAGSDDNSSGDVKSITVLGDGKGKDGLADLTFAVASRELCADGGFVMEVYNDTNLTSKRESTEAVKEAYSNCYTQSPEVLDQESAYAAERKVLDGDIKISTIEELKSYWDSRAESTESNLLILDTSFDTADLDSLSIPIKTIKFDTVSSDTYLGINRWDFALLPLIDASKLEVDGDDIDNFESIKYANKISKVELKNVGVTSKQLRNLSFLENLNLVSISNSAVHDATVFLPMVKKDPTFELFIDLNIPPPTTGPIKIY